MTGLDALLRHDSLQRLQPLVGRPELVGVEAVELVERFRDLSPSTSPRLAVFGRTASRSLVEDRLIDVTLRELVAHGVRAVVITGPEQSLALASTTGELAERLGFALLRCPEDIGVAELLMRCGSVLAGDGEQALRRLRWFLELTDPRTRAVGEAPMSAAELVSAAERALDAPVALETSNAPGVPVRLGPAEVGSIVATPPAGGGEVAGIAASIAAEILALRMERALEEQRRHRSGALLGMDSLLSELIVATEDHAVRLAQQARESGLPIDGWQRAFMFSADAGESPWSPDLLAALSESALGAMQDRERWLPTRSEGSLLLIETWPTDPRPVTSGHEEAERALARIDADFPSLALRCGIGAAHETVTGLRVSVAEAKVALASGPRHRVAAYDQAGLRPIIVELAKANAARASVSEMLGPILALGGRKAADIVRTLQVYLDEQGSLARASERLTLHRNSVAYRVKQARDLLGDDLDDADRRFALQLACRTYLLSEGRSE